LKYYTCIIYYDIMSCEARFIKSEGCHNLPMSDKPAWKKGAILPFEHAIALV